MSDVQTGSSLESVSATTLAKTATDAFTDALPKAELHLHIEGSITPERLMKLADANKVTLPYDSEADLLAAYDFKDLQSFLDLYYLGASVLQTEEDFYAMTRDYLEVCRAQKILHTEIGFDPQAHTDRGIDFDVVMSGITQAMRDARSEWGQSSLLLMNLLRHLPVESALNTIDQAERYGDAIIAVGLDSAELPFPPEPFAPAFERARALGWHSVAHAGEEGPPAYIWSALNTLKVDRIDHGVRSDEDPELIAHLKEHQVPLTVCPLSNVRLRVIDHMRDHNILRMLDDGVMVTANSDDPTYFGGFLNENYSALSTDLGMTNQQAIQLAHNSFQASFLDAAQKQVFANRLDAFVAQHLAE